MFKKIMVPVDLAHEDKLARALECAGEMAKTFKAELVFVGVTTATPGAVATTPGEYAEKLKAFATGQGESYGVTATSLPKVTHDVTIDVDRTLLEAAEEAGADLVIMASHVPGIVDYVWSSHGGRLASHAKISVMLVR